jgi:hypothetical protein
MTAQNIVQTHLWTNIFINVQKGKTQYTQKLILSSWNNSVRLTIPTATPPTLDEASNLERGIIKDFLDHKFAQDVSIIPQNSDYNLAAATSTNRVYIFVPDPRLSFWEIRNTIFGEMKLYHYFMRPNNMVPYDITSVLVMHHHTRYWPLEAFNLPCFGLLSFSPGPTWGEFANVVPHSLVETQPL